MDGFRQTRSAETIHRQTFRLTTPHRLISYIKVREIVGNSFGEGFILQCLLHFSFSVPSVINAILDCSLPPQLETLPKGLKMNEAPPSNDSRSGGKLSMDDKRRIV